MLAHEQIRVAKHFATWVMQILSGGHLKKYHAIHNFGKLYIDIDQVSFFGNMFRETNTRLAGLTARDYNHHQVIQCCDFFPE